MAVWIVILLLVAALAYLNQVGLPDFVKQPLLEKLRVRGLDLRFSRLRLRWYNGIVAENVRFGRTDEPLGPHLTASEVRLQLDHHALTRLQFQVDTLVLRQGRLELPIAETNQPFRQLTVDGIQTQLRLLPGDRWELDDLTARFAGARIQLAGTVENASAVRQWKIFKPEQNAAAGVWQHRLSRLADILEHTRFSAPPDLILRVWGDARDLQTFQARLGLSAPGAETPWGRLSHGMLTARIFPVASQELTRAEIRLEARGAETEWGAVTNLQLSIQAVSLATQTNLVTADMALLAGQAQTRWGSAFNTRFTAHWVHSLTNAVPLSGEGHLLCDYAETQYGSAKNFQVSGRLATLSGPPPRQSDDSWAWWADIEPYSLEWECRLADLRSPKIDADEITAAGRWCAPGLEITNLHARLYQARLDARASLDVATRALKANVTSDVDPFKFNPHFTPGLQHWLSQYSWVEPPDLQASVALVLPAWTNRQPDWRAEVRPTLRMEGQFSLPHGGAFRGVTATAASSHFSYSNFVWRLPDLVVIRPEGRIEAFHEAQELTKDYYCKVRSSIDPKTLRSILNTAAQRDLDLFTFSQPPLINAEIQGRWNDQTLTAFRGEVALTNFTFRGESADAFQTRLEYTNRFLLLTEARLQRSAEWLSASSLAVDFAAQKIYLTNGFGRMDVQVFTRTIGPEVARTMEPYRFDRPPTARAYGIIPMRAEDDADMYFDVEGGPFHWLRFNVPHVAGQVHWVGDRLTISNVLADFYGGRAGGSAALRFGSDNGTEFQFALSVTNSQLQPLMADVSTVSNRLEGTLSGNLVVTRANSDDWRSWQGYGAVDLRDGLVWAIPIFGVFSPVLDAVAPGLGSSRATDAAGHFTITNGVIVSDDLEIRSPAMRLAYRGEVDLQGQVNARVEAELLRDMWLVGPVVSSVFWPVEKLFEYEASGSLSQPRTEPVYFLPKLVLMPFHPIRTIKGLFPEDNSPPSTSTNSPSAHP